MNALNESARRTETDWRQRLDLTESIEGSSSGGGKQEVQRNAFIVYLRYHRARELWLKGRPGTLGIEWTVRRGYTYIYGSQVKILDEELIVFSGFS